MRVTSSAATPPVKFPSMLYARKYMAKQVWSAQLETSRTTSHASVESFNELFGNVSYRTSLSLYYPLWLISSLESEES